MYHMPSTALQSATIWVFFNEVKIYFVTDLYHVAHASSKDYGGRGEHCHLKNNYLKLSIYCILIMFFHPLQLLPDSPYFPTHSTLYSPPQPPPKKNNMKNNKNQNRQAFSVWGMRYIQQVTFSYQSGNGSLLLRTLFTNHPVSSLCQYYLALMDYACEDFAFNFSSCSGVLGTRISGHAFW